MHQQIFNFLQDRRFNRPAEQILIDLIYVAHEYQLELEHTKFGKARTLDQRPDLPMDGNTFIDLKVSPQFDDSFSGRSGFIYYRIPLEVLVDNLPITINHPTDFKTHDVLDQINAQLGSQLTEKDLVNESWFGGAAQVISIRAAEGSWVWNNKTLPAFELDVFSPLVLNGLTYDPNFVPPPPPPPPPPGNGLQDEDGTALEDEDGTLLVGEPLSPPSE